MSATPSIFIIKNLNHVCLYKLCLV
jgi:hypothetical protein